MTEKSARSRLGSGLAAVFLALLLLAGAVPYAVSSWTVARQASAVSGLVATGRIHSPQERIPAYDQALRWFDDSRLRADRAQLAVAAARLGEGSWLAAEGLLVDSLSYRPLDPFSWGRLSYVGQVGALHPPSRQAAWLLQSMIQGRFLPGFMQWRFILAMQLWPQLTVAQRQVVADQAGLLWRKKRSNFIRLGRVVPIAPAVEAVMREYYPDQLDTFLRLRRPLRHNHP